MSDAAIQPTVVVASMGALLAALHAKQQALGWSDAFVAEVTGINAAEVFENGRRPSCSTLDALLALFAVDLALVPAPSKAAALSQWWSGDRSTRAEPFRGTERARRAALARWSRTSPEERARVAAHAGRARWSRKEGKNAAATVDVR
jgi:hypothetical protein